MQTKNTPRMPSPSRARHALILAVSALMVFATQASAQQGLGFGERQSTEQLMADQLVAIAWRAFGQEQEPRPDQLVRAKILLDMASKMNPEDEGMWELRSILARTTQNQEMLIESLGNLMRFRGNSDDAIQLELIRAMLGSVEALDDYLESLENMLNNPSSAGLSAPLRSRLGTLAAQAAQEIGDDERAAAWLGYAVKLDPVNPDAARMIFQLTLDRGGSPRQQGAALVGLLKASPVDVTVRVGLAELLMKQGAYDQAAEQFKVAIDLSGDIQTRFSLLTPYVMCLIASGQEDKVPPLLLEVQQFLQQMADAQNPDQAVDPNAEPEVKDLPSLPSTLEFTRLILMHERNTVAAHEAFLRMRQAGVEAPDEEKRQSALSDLAWVGAVFKQELQWVRQRIESLPADDANAKLARGWLALHEGDTATAATLFKELGPDDIFARFGLASLPGLDDKQRAQAYQEVVWADSGSMGAIVAALRLHQMGKEVSATGEGVPLRVLVDNLPRQLWTPALTVSPWVSMKMRVSPGRFDYLQPMKAKVTIRNNTRLALSVGQGGAVQPILMVVTSPSIRSQPLGRLQPTFFNMGRRLTLAPGQSIHATVRLDRFELGQLVAMYPTATVTFQASALLDPKAAPNGGILPGPLGASHGVGSLQARGMPATANNLQLWISELDGTDPAVRAIAIARLLSIARQPSEGVEAGDTRSRISDLIGERYPTFDSLLKAWTVRFMLADEDGEPVSRRVIDLAERSDDPLVRIVYMVTQVDDPSSAALTDAIRHDNPLISGFAQALKEGLALDEQRRQEIERQQEQGDPLGPPPAEDPFKLDDLPELSPSLDDPWLP